jgi:uncharacterized protein involved in exopolysaccharide biosynthesis
VSALGAVIRRGLGLAWENRWTFSVPVATLLVPATLHVVHLPDTYRATATVRVSPPRLPTLGAAIPQEQDSRAETLLATAKDQLLQKSNVQAVLPILRPALTPSDPDGVKAVQGAVTFDQIPSEAGFKVSIEDQDPEVASEAVNALLKAFLANERASRLERATMKRKGVEKGVAAIQADVDGAQAALHAFRAAHGDTMPDRKDAVTSEILRVETQLRDREAAAANARRIGQEYEKLMRQTPPDAKTTGPSQTAEEEHASITMHGAQAALAAARKELSASQTKYTEKHPTVVQLRAEVARLEADVATAKADLEAAHRDAAATAAERRGTEMKPWIDSLRQIRADVVEEESRANAEADRLRARAAALQATLTAIPETQRAAEPLLSAVDDAAKALREEKEKLRNAREAEEAFRTADDLEVTSYGVAAWAVPPVSPSGPGRVRILATAVAAGLLLGYLVLILRRKYGEGAVTRPEDVQDLVPEALVVRVPVLQADHHDRKARLREAGLAVYVGACLVVAGFSLAAHKGWVSPPEWFRGYLGNHRA